jgi:flavin-binding protein dodecin
MIELAGSSETSIEDAIQNAITRAAKTLHDLRWFEVVETRGHIEGGRVVHYQVVIKVGFTIEE